MATLKQIQANRQNAKRSTGPRSAAGKVTIRFNAVEHGLTAKYPVLPGESSGSLRDFARSINSVLQPVGRVEEILAEQIVTAAWRLRRMRKVEAEIFSSEMDTPLNRFPDVHCPEVRYSPGLAFIRDSIGANAFTKLSRYEVAIERSLYRAMHELQRLQASRAGQDVPLPVVGDIGLDYSAGDVSRSSALALDVTD